MGFELRFVPRAMLESLWPELAPRLEEALHHSAGESQIEDIHQLLREAKMQGWAIVDRRNEAIVGAGATRVTQYPRLMSMDIYLLEGEDMEVWADTIFQQFWDKCRMMRCDLMRFFGREGWRRKAPRFGFKPQYCVMTRDV